jgi:hypothetical protein
LTTPKELPLDHYIVESMVLPLAVYHLFGHPLWSDKTLFPSIEKKYKIARDLAESRTPDQGNSCNLVGTPRGY